MMRIAALVAVVLLLLGGGLWLARDKTPATATASSTTSDGSSATAPSADAADEEPAVPGMPEGFEALAPLSTEPERSFEQAASVLEPDTDYIAILETDHGPITLDLFETEAPVTVNNFVFLALHHYYDGVPFHRVLKDFMAQTGDPTGTGTGGPGYAFDNEISADLSFDQRGVVAMANAGPDTNGSQFFITFAATPWLDGSYNVFGAMTAGDEALSAITLVDPSNPSAIARNDDTLESLADQGVTLPGDPDETVGDVLEAALGTLPVAGQTATVAGIRVSVGSVGGEPAFGFFPHPDTLKRVIIASRPTN